MKKKSKKKKERKRRTKKDSFPQPHKKLGEARNDFKAVIERSREEVIARLAFDSMFVVLYWFVRANKFSWKNGDWSCFCL